MIILFGPPGAGKSVQGQILSARYGWRWLSAGQLLRDSRDPALLDTMRRGSLVEDDLVNGTVGEAIRRGHDVERLVLDGFPRVASQARWLVEHQAEHERAIASVIVLAVPEAELLRRLQLRGRLDDTGPVVHERQAIYQREIPPVLEYFAEHGVPVTHLDGTGTVGEVHDRIAAHLRQLHIIPAEK